MPISMARLGEHVIIRKIIGSDEARRRLAELGFVVNNTISIVSKIGENLIIQVKDSRVALDSSVANRILF